MRHPQEVKGFRFSQPSLLSVCLCKPAELNEPRLVGVQVQPEVSKPFPQVVQEAICLSYDFFRLLGHNGAAIRDLKIRIAAAVGSQTAWSIRTVEKYDQPPSSPKGLNGYACDK